MRYRPGHTVPSPGNGLCVPCPVLWPLTWGIRNLEKEAGLEVCSELVLTDAPCVQVWEKSGKMVTPWGWRSPGSQLI